MDGYLDGYAVVGSDGGGRCASSSPPLSWPTGCLRPTWPTPEKHTTYECGLDPVGDGWAQTHIRYYVFAYLYVIFAVDAVYLFPWATIFDAPGYGATTPDRDVRLHRFSGCRDPLCLASRRPAVGVT